MSTDAEICTERVLEVLKDVRHYLPVHGKAHLVETMNLILVSERRRLATYLDGMAENAKNHGYIDATSYHKAYEQGIREAADALRATAKGEMS